jgi:hypothetical protein
MQADVIELTGSPPLVTLSPKATRPSREIASDSLKNRPPGRSPMGVKLAG